VGLPDAASLLLKGFSHLAPHLHVYSLKNEIFSRDPEAVARMNADPLIEKESQPAETSAEMLRASERLTENFPKFTVPLLIIHGTADKATRPAGSERFYRMAGSQDKTLKLYEGHYHDLLNDIDREVVMADIQAWIDARLARAATTPMKTTKSTKPPVAMA
jgi:acylglycerol lipase